MPEANSEGPLSRSLQSVPLSVSQEALWISWEIEPDQARYLIPYPLRVDGMLEIGRLRRAADELGARYPVLRGRVIEAPAGPRLTWADAPPIAVVEQILSDPLSAAVPQARTGLFNLRTGPLARMEVLRGSEATLLVIWVHHIVFDGGSFPTLLAELRRAYEGESLGPATDTRTLAEFALRQRAIATGDEGAPHRDFWSSYLRGPIPAMRLPAGPDAGKPSLLSFALNRDLTGSVIERARELGATQFSLFFSAFLILLQRHLGQEEITVAIPFHGRVHSDLRNVIGFFSNTLPIRQRISSSDTYADVIQAVHANVRGTLAHGELPMTIIRSEIIGGGSRDNGNELPVLFQYWDANLRPDLDVRAVVLHGGNGTCTLETLTISDLAEYPFTVMVRNDSAGTTIVWKDPSGLAGPALIEAMRCDYTALLHDMTANPARLAAKPAQTGTLFHDGQVEASAAPLRLPRLRPHSPGARRLEYTDVEDLPADALVRFAAFERTEVPDVLLAALAAMLSWYTGQDNLVIGIAGDDSPGGPVPVLLRSWPGQSFRESIQVASAARGVALTEPRDLDAGHDVVFSCSGSPGQRPDLVTAEDDVDLHLHVQRSGATLPARLYFDGQCFDRWQARAMASHLARLLEHGMARPQTAVSEFEPLSARERHDHLVTWNDTYVGHPDAALPALLRRQAQARPQATALTWGGDRRTYGELIAKAQEMARALVVRGVRPGELVALLLPRGIGQIEAILGVLFAGAGYLPVDPATPADRLHFMMADAEVRLAITGDPDDQSRFKGLMTQALHIDDLALAGADVDVPLNAPAPGQPAYCIYTSGTTGRPKGVVISHQNVVRLVCSDYFPLDFRPDDVWLQFHPYSFDVSVWEIFGCLCNGGRLVLASDAQTKDGQLLWRVLRQEQVTVLGQTPSAFTQLQGAAAAESAPVTSLRYVIFAGEALWPRSLERWMARHPHVRLVNMYGITETTVHSTYRFITEADVASDTSNVGFPLPTTVCYVVDPGNHRRLVPAGVAGELLVGGFGVAGGYVKRPELTGERFLPNPFGGGLVFRSGDLVRRGPDGAMEFLGRKDNQVKVLGYRIELGEIESCLRERADVARAVVQLDEKDQNRLVAFVIPAEPDQPPSAAGLRNELRKMLPEYMIPAAFCLIQELPLTRNGKLDRGALRNLAVPLPETEGGQPSTATAQGLVRIWTEMLDRTDIYGGSSFFDLGGHSLRVTGLINQIEENFNVRLPVRAIFDHPRLQDLADLIDGQVADG